MRVAIIGAGLAGLGCAIECERLGVVPDIYERDYSVGWKWPSVMGLPNIFTNNVDDPLKDLRENYNISVKALTEINKIIMKSPNQECVIEGKLGYFFTRGKGPESTQNQLLRLVRKSPIFYNNPADYKRLSKEYDYVIIASGKDTEAAELGVWENKGQVTLIGGVALGKFNINANTIYFNTEYAGSGFGHVSPFSPTQAIVSLYIIGHEPYETEKRFSKFLKVEGLENLEFFNTLKPPVFQTGKVTKFKVGNILLTGRAAGLTDRLIGLGGIYAIISGVLAARAIINNLDYDAMIKPIQEHLENISSFRNITENFSNEDHDKLLLAIKTPGIKQLIYNTNIDFIDFFGTILKKMKK